jgi:uncharacterized protein (DUF924 family)
VIASQSIHNFWFEELPAKQHFVKDTALEATITHRNAILVRTSSAEELAFLSEPGSSF